MFLANLATLEQQHNTIVSLLVRPETIKPIKLPKNTAPSLHGFVDLGLFSLIS